MIYFSIFVAGAIFGFFIGAIFKRYKKREEAAIKYNYAYFNADKCVHCGEVIPEGRMSCPKCESEVEGE